MNRAEHLAWTKHRAMEYVEQGDPVNAYASLVSDLRKHPETREHAAIDLGGMLAMGGHLSTAHEVREFIGGVN